MASHRGVERTLHREPAASSPLLTVHACSTRVIHMPQMVSKHVRTGERATVFEVSDQVHVLAQHLREPSIAKRANTHSEVSRVPHHPLYKLACCQASNYSIRGRQDNPFPLTAHR